PVPADLTPAATRGCPSRSRLFPTCRDRRRLLPGLAGLCGWAPCAYTAGGRCACCSHGGRAPPHRISIPPGQCVLGFHTVSLRSRHHCVELLTRIVQRE